MLGLQQVEIHKIRYDGYTLFSSGFSDWTYLAVKATSQVTAKEKMLIRIEIEYCSDDI